MVKLEEKKNHTNTTTVFFRFLVILLFLVFAFKFNHIKGSQHPLFSCLFNMVILLSILIYLYHLKDIKEDKKIIMRQTHLENYFKKVKELLNE